jgi:H+/gluconate symporter-like permease
MDYSNSTDPDVIPDTPQIESAFETGLVVFLTPFVAIPLCIIAFRFIKYVYKVREAKKYGYGSRYFT